MALQLNGTAGVTYNDGSNQPAAASPIGTKNLIINGNMQIAQRGTSVTGITSGGYCTADRWSTSYANSSATWTQTQSTDVPTGQGFSNSLKMQCTTASAVGTNERLMVGQRFEGQMLQHLKKGTANAESLTLSFWVKSNKTGTYIANLYDSDNTRYISKAYTINTADTWEKKIITFAGDTTGVLDNDNNQSMLLFLALAVGTFETSGTLQTSWGSAVATDRFVGQVNLGDAVNNYINITGVQLEVGDTATPFEVMPYDMQLARCQRYYYLHCEGNARAVANGAMYTAAVAYANIKFPVNMRTDPSIEVASATNFRVFAGNGTSNATSVSIWSQGGTTNEYISLSGLSRVQGQACFIDTTDVACKLAFISEL